MRHQSQTVVYELTAGKFKWEIAPGKTINAWGLNEQVPGPVLRAKVGDTLIIRVKNELDEPTTIHWHGLRIPPAMDGTGVVQKPILPGETFEYRFELPDAGTFWYHSHANETVQMERGMYGALIVEDPAEPVIADNERILVIDDMKLNSQNEFTKPSWFVPRVVERHDGRQGNTILINGKEQPVVNMFAGQMERWRIINASSARYVHLYMEGKPFQVIGTDGGLLEHPLTMTKLLLTPGERVDVIAGPFNEGEQFAVETLAYKRMTFAKPRRQNLFTVEVGEKKESIARIPERLAEIKSLAQQDAPINR